MTVSKCTCTTEDGWSYKQSIFSALCICTCMECVNVCSHVHGTCAVIIRIFKCLYMFVYRDMCVCVCVCVCVCLHAHTLYVHTYGHIYEHICAYIQACIHSYTYTCIHNIHAYIHTYIHTYIHWPLIHRKWIQGMHTRTGNTFLGSLIRAWARIHGSQTRLYFPDPHANKQAMSSRRSYARPCASSTI